MRDRLLAVVRVPTNIPSIAVLPVRAFLGVTFLYAGVQKVIDPQFLDPTAPTYIGEQLRGFAGSGSPLSQLITQYAIPNASLVGTCIALAEIWIGLFTLTGLLARPAAAAGLFTSIVFYLTATWTVRPYFVGSDLPYAACWLTLLLTGPGSLSLDARYFGEIGAPRADMPGSPRAYLRSPGAVVSRGAFLRAAGTTLLLLVSGSLTAALGWLLAPVRPADEERAADLDVPSTTQAGVVNPTPGSTADNVSAGATPTNTRVPVPVEASSAPIDTSATATPARVPRTPTTTASVADPAQIPPDSSRAKRPAARPGPKPTPTATEPHKPDGMPLGNVRSLPLNRAASFTNPKTGEPFVLIRLATGKLVAFSALCTHAGCAVRYNPRQEQLICPCHLARYDPAHGARVISGPAPRPLRPLTLRVMPNGDIYTTDRG